MPPDCWMHEYPDGTAGPVCAGTVRTASVSEPDSSVVVHTGSGSMTLTVRMVAS